MRQFLPSSPCVGHLSMQLIHMQPGSTTLAMPFDARLITIGTAVHGAPSPR
jgi:acyl-coenzyme A thioesterase PaaI-like protein